MLLDVVTRLLPEALVMELEALHPQLLAFSGHRSIWLDDDGQLWHAEPDEMLEDLGHVYVGTFFQPLLEDLAIAVSKAYPKPMRPLGRVMPPQAAVAAAEQAATA
jgi:hypothetical protein